MILSHNLVVVITLVVAMVLIAGPVAADWSAGVDHYQHGRFAEAGEHFQAVVESNPKWPGGYLMLGRCQLALGRHDDALENLRTAAKLDPDDPANIATLSRALMAVGRHAEARDLLERLDLEKLSASWRVGDCPHVGSLPAR